MTEVEFFYLTNYSQGFGSLLIAVLAFAKPKNMQKQVLIMGTYGINSVIFQCVQTGFNSFGKINPNPFGNIYVLTETIILLWLFSNAFNKVIFTRVILAGAVLYTLIFVWFALPDLDSLHSNIRTIRDLTMIVASLLYFFLLLKDLPEQNLYALPMFWINAGILFFFSCTFLFSLSTAYLVETLREQYGYFLGFRNLLRVLFCLIVCVGIWKSYASRNKKLTGGND